MNTIWADTGGIHDDLTTTAQVRGWLITSGDADPALTCTPAELERARLLRDALRRLAAHRTDDARRAARSPLTDLDEAIAAVNELAADTPPTLLAVRDGQLTLDDTAAPTATTALAAIATEAIALFTDPNAPHLHACHAPRCVRYYTAAHSRREWCSQACGNRVRAARHYQRIRKG